MNHIKIDLERITSDIDRNIFGGYLEITRTEGRLAHLNIGDSPQADKSLLRSDIRTALERMNLSIMRFGGNFFSGYRWMDGVGPKQDRPARHDLAWNRITQNQFGTNEFIQLCRALNVEPYLNVNGGDGSMREAADWVEYCNGTGDTALANLRRKHGFEEPHNVKYWGIGNEVDGDWQIGYKTPAEYAREYTEFSKVMKRTDPNIKLIASAVSYWEDSHHHPGLKTQWVERAQLMLEQAGDRIDYMAIHRYAHTSYDDPFETYMAFGEDLNERLNAYEGLIKAVSLERGIKHAVNIAVDELGVSRVPSDLVKVPRVNLARDEWGVMRIIPGKETISERGRIFINLEDALVEALYLNAFIRHSASVRLVNFATMPIMPLGLSLTDPDSPVLIQPIFYPFEIYSHTCGKQALDVFWYGDTFSANFLDRSYNGIRTLDVAATLDESRKQLVVYVINQSKNDAMETVITLTSGQFAGDVNISVVNGPDVKAENTVEAPNQVGVRELNLKASGTYFTYTFEPHSVTALVCRVS
jgi:alpha-N-arabinofuranosidase